jgi:hypothetical protein
MQIPINSTVKVVAGKFAGQQGTLVSSCVDAHGARSEVRVKHRSFLRFFHFMKFIEVPSADLVLA